MHNAVESGLVGKHAAWKDAGVIGRNEMGADDKSMSMKGAMYAI